jgi:CHAT domain-containing protein
MAHPRGLHVESRIISALISLFVFVLVSAAPLVGQSNPFPWPDPVTHTPANTGLPPQVTNALQVDLARGVTGGNNPFNPPSPPSPMLSPTWNQTQRFIENHPALKNLDPISKMTLVYGGPGSSAILNSQYLNNGQPNPFYQNGQVVPNWYLPTTWSSRQMNWMGVQPNGFLPSASPTTYSWSSGVTPYNPSSYAPNYRPPVYQPPTPTRVTPNSSQQPTGLRPPLAFRPSAVAKAVENSQRALALSESAGDKVGQITNHAALARLFVQQGNLDQAFMHLSVAETMSKAVGDPRLQANLLQTGGAAYMSSGEFEKSLDAYRQAISILKPLGDEVGQAEVYTSIGWAYQSLGDVPHALTSYQGAQELFIKAGNKGGEVRASLGIGSLYQSIGEFNKATEQYAKALPIVSLDQYVRMIVSVAEMHQSLHLPNQALTRYEKALLLIRSPGDATLEGSILAGMGRCHMTLGSYDKAQNDFERARAKMKGADNRLGEAGVITSIGELNYWIAVSSPTVNPKSRFLEALRDYNEALPMMREGGDRIGEIGILTNTGLVYDAWGKSREALPYYLEALRKMDELETSARLEEFRLDLAGQSASLYQRAILLEASLHHMQEAFDLSERARARSFLDQLGNRRIDLGNHRSADFSIREEKLRQENILLQRQLGQELAKPGPEMSPERTRSIQAQLFAVRKEYEDLVTQLKLSNPEYASFLSISPLTLREAQQQLARDVTVLSYYTTADMTLAFVLTRDSFHVSKLSVTELQLFLAVTTFLDFSGQSDVPPSLKLLYKSLIAPVKSQLKTSKLAVVPYGVLQGLPFAALTPDGQHFLSDSYAVFYLPSVSVLPYIRARVKSGGSQALVLANDQEEGLPRLSYAEGEARSVASLLGTQPLLGDAATTSVLRSKAGDYDVVHLIAHFDLDSQHPQSSRIILGQSKGNDGSLELNDIFGLDLRKTNLVVLSGCKSQRGNRTRGDDVIGLSRAFIYAGSPSVVASLWSVDDDATQQLMIAFYTHLKEGLTKAEALRIAQADIRRKYPNPFYWAGFVLTGDPGQVDASKLLASSIN